TWSKNPIAVEPRMLALEAWINNELNYFDDLLKAIRDGKKKEDQIVSNIDKLLKDSLWAITSANLPLDVKAEKGEPTKLSDKDMTLVRELNQYLPYEGQRFDIDTYRNARRLFLLYALAVGKKFLLLF